MCNNLESVVVKGVTVFISLFIFDPEACGFGILIDNRRPSDGY